jgi:glycosyltransferase involved in cell wall biosynthesis
MGILKELIDTDPTLLQGAKILYDAEAIYCLREARERALLGKPLRPSELESRMRDELELSQGCAGIIAVNNAEAQHFRDYCSQPVHTLGHALESCPTPNSFEQRSGLLFVGAIHDPISPNGDSTRWLVREIMPAIDRSTGTPVPLSLAGYWCPGVITDPIDEQRIRVLGRVDDLTCLYNEARIFVAPTRFAGGIPLKVYEAAAHGVPVVATSLIRQQLGWTADEEILVADTPEEFAAQCLRLYQDPQLWRRVREAALRATMRDCSSEAFIRKLEEILDKTMDRGAFTLAIPEPHFTQRRQAEQEGRFSLVSRHG